MVEIAKDVTVTGRVQGVGFRAWTASAARGLGLRGWVRNEPDGSVRAVIAGAQGAVDAMLAEMENGPSWARVDRVDVLDTALPQSTSFEVRR